jgi:hypothetical protein
MAGDIALFVRQYARKAPKRGEPNDRRYSRRVYQLVSRIDPEDLDLFLRDEVLEEKEKAEADR